MDPKELLARIDLAVSRRRTVEPAVREIIRLAFPWVGDIHTNEPQNPSSRRVLPMPLDTTMLMAAAKFVSFLKSLMIPAQDDYIKVSVPPPGDRLPALRRGGQMTSRRLLRMLAQSNFYQQSTPWVRDVSVLGTGTLWAEEKTPTTRNDVPGSSFGGFRFRAVPWKDMYFLCGIDGTPIFQVRVVDVPAIDAFRFFEGEPGARALLALKTSPMELVRYHHCAWFNENGTPGPLKHPTDKPWVTAWCQKEPNRGVLDILRVRGQDHSPLLTARWDLSDESDQGTGQGHVARADAKGASKLRELVLRAAGRDLAPPFIVEEETAVKLDFGPNGIIVARPHQKVPMGFLHSNARYDVANQIGVETRDPIRLAFLSDLIDGPDTEPRSAEAVIDNRQRFSLALSPHADMSYSEMLAPLVVFMMNRAEPAGHLPELTAMRQQGVEELQLDFVSPFFTSQKTAPSVRLHAFLNRWVAVAANTGRADVLDNFDLDAGLLFDSKHQEVPAELIRDPRLRDAVRQQRQQQIDTQRQVEQTERLAGAAAKAAPLIGATTGG